jgi:hypothetical protein
VDQLISHRVSALAATLDNEIRMKVDESLGPLLAKRVTMKRELMTTNAHLSTMENVRKLLRLGDNYQQDGRLLRTSHSLNTSRVTGPHTFIQERMQLLQILPLSSSLPRATFQGEWLIVVNFFARHTSPQSSTIGVKIDTALASSAGAGDAGSTRPPCEHMCYYR